MVAVVAVIVVIAFIHLFHKSFKVPLHYGHSDADIILRRELIKRVVDFPRSGYPTVVGGEQKMNRCAVSNNTYIHIQTAKVRES